MTSSTRRIGVAALVLLPGLLLAGCSSTGGSGASGGSGSGAEASAKAVASAVASAGGTTTAPKASGPITTGDQLCALVSKAEVQAAEGAPTLTRQVSDSGLDGEPVCGYTNADGTEILSVTLYSAKKDPFNIDKGDMSGEKLTPVSGLGDKAGVSADELDVLKGDHLLTVESVGTKDLKSDSLVILGKLFAPRI